MSTVVVWFGMEHLTVNKEMITFIHDACDGTTSKVCYIDDAISWMDVVDKLYNTFIGLGWEIDRKEFYKYLKAVSDE